MLQYIRNAIRRHSKKIFWTTGVVSISYLLGIYVRNKIREFQEQLKQENATRDLIKKRFAQTQKDCYMTFLSFLPVLVEPIYKELNVEQITKELKLSRKDKSSINEGKSEITSDDLTSTTLSETLEKGSVRIENVQKKTKVELWQSLKLKALTRFLTLVFSESLLIILLHLQLNIISRKSYLKTALKLASTDHRVKLMDLDSDQTENDEDLPEQAFLSFTWWLLNKGSLKLKSLVEASIREVFDKVSLRDELNIDQFGSLIHQAQDIIDMKLKEQKYDHELYDDIEMTSSSGHKIPTILSFLLPPKEQEFTLLQNTNTLEFLTGFNLNSFNIEALDKMNSELKTYLMSDQVHNLVSKIAGVGISSILLKVDESLLTKYGSKHTSQKASNNTAENTEKFSEMEFSKWKLALILGVLTPQTQELSNRRIDNPVLYAMNNAGDLDGLSASVYSNFDL